MIICWRIKYRYSFKFFSFFFYKIKNPWQERYNLLVKKNILIRKGGIILDFLSMKFKIFLL